MRPITPGLTLAGIAALFLVACGGGGGGSSSSSSSGGAANTPPTANAGANQTVNSGVTVTLNGGASSDSDGTIASYAWTQTGGSPTVPLNVSIAQPTFQAPTVTAASVLTFSLVVTDNRGTASAAATVTVTVNPAVAGNSNVTGRVTFARVPFAATVPNGLNYAAQTQQPARGVLVEAIAVGTSNVLATGTTNNLGDYTLSVASNSSIMIRVTAQMQRTGTPSWDVRVINRLAGNTNPHAYNEDSFFNSSAGTAHNIAIPAGIDATGTATGARSSGAFAVLDTVYQGIQTILGVAPDTVFPALIVDWGSQTDGTFFTVDGGVQLIALLADLTEDTDEFDQHVIAHEFGHYIENNFSRADNIGGSHGIGDRLDIRVAFGEGFGTAFSAIVLNDPNWRDSFVDNGTQFSSRLNVELNPATNLPATPGDGLGCYCSESSVSSILWDLYDTNADVNDNIAIGFAPIWAILIGPQRTTPAFTSIFSFITALKAARPGDSAAINTLVSAQNIDSAVINAFATNETHTPSNDVLPLYTNITVGVPTSVRSHDDLGHYNKISNRRFLRFTPAASGAVTVSVTSSNPNNADPDFFLMQAGDYLLFETEPPPQPEIGGPINVTAGTTYVLDVYDCANGCNTAQGTPGDYDLNVTIN